MATKALTYVAPRVSRDLMSPRTHPGHGRDWHDLLIKEDGDAIWQKVAHLIRAGCSKSQPVPDEAIQEVFLRLLINGRFTAYIDLGFSEEAINLEILACFSE